MARQFGQHWLMEGVAEQMWREARLHRYNGLETERNMRIMQRCTGDHLLTGTRLLFTFDEGMHSSGWWKNPEYERCWHLSISFRDPISGTPAPRDIVLTGQWLEAFYHENQRYIWAEPPYSPEGKKIDVWHYRVFCNPAWEPIVPRGEVYSREFTERGWLSFSDLQNDHAKALAAIEALPGEL